MVAEGLSCTFSGILVHDQVGLKLQGLEKEPLEKSKLLTKCWKELPAAALKTRTSCTVSECGLQTCRRPV